MSATRAPASDNAVSRKNRMRRRVRIGSHDFDPFEIRPSSVHVVTVKVSTIFTPSMNVRS
jgi:hypothetical protein